MSQWMSGTRNPSLTSLKKIAAVTGNSLHYFLTKLKV
ncbi:MAG: helix-turn-helix domain-containing protein [Endomicrobium sp.]|nr:helix-turn-helix domain-containing protein [Endomicrobium sp.]